MASTSEQASEEICYNEDAFSDLIRSFVSDDESIGGMSGSEELELVHDLTFSEVEFGFDDETPAEEGEDKEEDEYNMGDAGRTTGTGKRRAKGKKGPPKVHNNTTPGAHSKSYDDPDSGNTLPAFNPSRPPGVHYAFLEGTMMSALEFFQLFFTTEMIGNIVKNTNSYAYNKLGGATNTLHANRSTGFWDATTPEEMNNLIGLLIYFSVVKIAASYDKYWSTKAPLHGLWARAFFSRERFNALMTYLHIIDPNTKTPKDLFLELESSLSNFKEKCKQLYQPALNLVVDEQTHRFTQKQKKQVKTGVKLWVLTDSSNSYVVNFEVYLGKSASDEISEHGLGYEIVMRLAKPFLNQGYHLFFNHFYTSFKLVDDLLLAGTPSTGKVKTNTKGYPVSLKKMRKWACEKRRGHMRWDRVDKVLALQWTDDKPRSFLTTIDNANSVKHVKRKRKINTTFSEIVILQPEAINRYNKHMNSVDINSDQIMTADNLHRRCRNWWKTLFLHLIDIAVTNSFILFQKHREDYPNIAGLQRTRDYCIVDFRAELVRQLGGFKEYAIPPLSNRVKPKLFETDHMPKSSDARRNCRVCYKESRIQRKVHFSCSAPQCSGKYFHIRSVKSGEPSCFEKWHSDAYHNQ